MKILIFGGGGFLGSEFKKILDRKKINYLAPSFAQVDVTTLQMESLVRSFAPDFILNCTAHTDVDGAEADVEQAYLLNADVPKRMAKIAREVGAGLVHFSTDYVFDGRKGAGYVESDQPNPLSVYGKSKLEGEKNIQEIGGKFLIIRTSFPFGESDRCFLQKILKQIEAGKKLRVIDDLICSPTSFAELAERVVELLGQDFESGIYHLTNFGECSRFEFTREVCRILGADSPEPTELIQTGNTAERPLHSTLRNTKLPEMTPWNVALENYLKSRK